MSRPLLSLLALAPLAGHAGPAGPAPDELERRLDELSAAEVGIRGRAELWLGENLDAGDYRTLVQRARSGDAEVRMRLGRAVSVADRDLSLATLFLAESDRQLVAIGERALRDRVVRWNPLFDGPVAVGDILTLHLRDQALRVPPTTLRLSLAGTLGEVCARLERHADLPFGLAVDPGLGDQRRGERSPAELVGSWEVIVPLLADAYGVVPVGHGLVGEPEDQRFAFLRMTRPAEAREDTLTILLRWCRDVLSATDSLRRVESARALASSGWPDALAWLETRLRAGDDLVGLEGVLHAAAAGRQVPAFQHAEAVRRLLELADADLGSDRPTVRARADRIADGLRRAGCVAPDGQPLSDVVLDGWEQLGEEQRWLRLVVLEGTRCPRGHDRARETLMDASASGRLRRQGLRALVAAIAGRPRLEPGTAPLAIAPLPDAASLLGVAATAEEGAELARLLALAGFAPPSELHDPARLPADWDMGPRVAVLGWLAESGAAVEAGQHLTALLMRTPGDASLRGQELQRALSPWRRRGELDRVILAWRAARQVETNPARALELDRLGLLMGAVRLRGPAGDLGGAEEGPAGVRDRPRAAGCGRRVGTGERVAGGAGPTPDPAPPGRGGR